MKIDKRNKSVEIKCYNCGNYFNPYSGREKTSKYCSMKCMGKYRRGKPNGKPKTGKWVKCLICKKEFYEYEYLLDKRIFCSKKCHYQFRKGKQQTEKHIKSRVEGRIGYSHSKETRIKIGKANKGKPQLKNRGTNNYRWKGGITSLNLKIRTSLEYKNWRREVYKRDNYTCQITGEIGGKLHCHHIVPFASILNEIRYAYPDGKITFERAKKYSFLFDTENGITLSKKIHKDKHKS